MPVKKTILFTDSAAEAVLRYKREHGITSWTAALNEMLCHSVSMQEQQRLIAKEVREMIKAELKKDFDGIRFSSRATEYNSLVLMRGVDTIISAMGLKEDAYPKSETTGVMTKIKDDVLEDAKRTYQLKMDQAAKRQNRANLTDGAKNVNAEPNTEPASSGEAGRSEDRASSDWLYTLAW